MPDVVNHTALYTVNVFLFVICLHELRKFWKKYVRFLLIIHNKKKDFDWKNRRSEDVLIVTPPRIAQINFNDLWYSDTGWEVRTSLWSHMWSAHGDSSQSVTDSQSNTMVRHHAAFWCLCVLILYIFRLTSWQCFECFSSELPPYDKLKRKTSKWKFQLPAKTQRHGKIGFLKLKKK